MASKKSKKCPKIINKPKDYNALTLNEVLCPICRSILIEPVSLPCNHDFCLFCFEGTMENANLVCPLCRMRIGSWLRKVRKDNILINGELWKIIKEKFQQHVKNKLNGVDENLEEKRDIIVAKPGEIRKEYEVQRQKELEEQNRKKAQEIKASEDLIKKIKEEEEYQKSLLEEKLKCDEMLAKKLAEKLSNDDPSSSKSKPKSTPKKRGPLDKFVKKDEESKTNNPNTFANKDYTCWMLQSDSEAILQKVPKKIHQLQKLVDLDTHSDGSDCIESEMRYFKPIDYRLNPPSHRKPPLKVIPKKLAKSANVKILSPCGLRNFSSSNVQSAFAKFPKDTKIDEVLPSTRNSDPQSSKKHGLSFSHEDGTPSKKHKKNSKDESVKNCNVSPLARKKLFENTARVLRAESPPFYGFDSSFTTRKNGGHANEGHRAKEFKKEQEKADLEYAKKLQEEINRGHYTRSTRHLNNSKRQMTLDGIIKSPYKVK
ncbi:unnamed protein product [Phyllotreta striolata]|uniref:RING-type E3 ubiquitin transferase n=1 Tax=Phyllotreta striolata TaxID=444603 RepID=A0A9N9TQB1_PHYSR|nr:unnamed protein product [Phyllotreta striolata]